MATEAEHQIVERGQDFTVLKSVRIASDGRAETNQFTLLENAINYQEMGEWKESADLIESFAGGGAIARRGPNRAIFSDELNVESVFDIETSDGKRIRGGVRAIQATDFQTGKTVDPWERERIGESATDSAEPHCVSICIRRN
jgi:hypothetical protein